MSRLPEPPQRLNLREQVESSLPGWQSWYPSLFDAAADLGLIRARVCAPSSLLLSTRHAAVQQEALQAFKEKWEIEAYRCTRCSKLELYALNPGY